MRAICQTGFGPAEDVLEMQNLDRPTPGPGEVLVRVKAAGIALGNTLITRGLPWIARPMYGLRRPKQPISGLQFAGVVEEVGPGVTEWMPGDDVFGSHPGAFAEAIAVPAEAVTRKPAVVTYADAATVPISGTAALQAVRDAGRVEPGHRVLVIGASGGVGSFAVQIARAYGAEVTGVASTPNLAGVLQLGAADVIDYTRESISAREGNYDLVIDIAGNRSLGELRSVLAPRGCLVIVGGSGGRFAMGFGRTIRAMALDRFVDHRLVGLLSMPNPADLAELAQLLADGRITPNVQLTLPLERAAEGVGRVADGHRGGVALAP